VHVGAWRQLITNFWASPEAHVDARGETQAALWHQAALQTYPRLSAPVLCRPAGPLACMNGQVPGRDVLRGLAVMTDEVQRAGSLLELEVLTGTQTVQLVVRVVAVQRLPSDAPARYDVALELCDVDPDAVSSLRAVLDYGHPFGHLDRGGRPQS
jgi:hypothetical protein